MGTVWLIENGSCQTGDHEVLGTAVSRAVAESWAPPGADVYAVTWYDRGTA